jgi:hypothetical protein
MNVNEREWFPSLIHWELLVVDGQPKSLPQDL